MRWCFSPVEVDHYNTEYSFFSVSKQASIVPSQSYELADGTDSYKEFTNSRNNRFTNPGQAAKNRIQPPSNVLHFFNAPLCVTEEYFQEVRFLVTNGMVKMLPLQLFAALLLKIGCNLVLSSSQDRRIENWRAWVSEKGKIRA